MWLLDDLYVLTIKIVLSFNYFIIIVVTIYCCASEVSNVKILS